MHPSRIRYWLTGRGNIGTIIPRTFADDNLLTFSELMELQFIHMFREHGVSLQTIRRAAIAAAQEFKVDHPFSVKRFDTDGKNIFATIVKDEGRRPIVKDLKHGQLVFRTIIKPFFKKLEYRGMEIGRYWPMKKSGRVVLDPRRHFGQPIDAETGTPTSAIASAVAARGGQDIKAVAKWFEIPVEAVRAAVKFEKTLAG